MKLFQDKNRGERGTKCKHQVTLNFDQAQWIKILTLSNELNVTTSNVIRLAIRRSIMTERPDRPFTKLLLVTEAERRALRSEAKSRNMCVNSFVRKAITEL